MKAATTFYEKRKLYEQHRLAQRNRVPVAPAATPAQKTASSAPAKAAKPAPAAAAKPAPAAAAKPAPAAASKTPVRAPATAVKPAPARPAPRPRAGVPARTASYQIHPISRRVNWPQLLRRDCFAQPRAEIERLVAEQTVHNSGLGSQNCEDIRRAVEQMKSLLKGQIKSTRPEEYLNARRFLDSVAHEARFVAAPGLQSVARW
jgi:hypothetical protein